MTGNLQIEVTHISILNEKNYAVITFIQNYQSSALSDVGKKELYVKKNMEGKWKVLREAWSKDGIDEHLKIAFVPQLKFFKAS